MPVYSEAELFTKAIDNAVVEKAQMPEGWQPYKYTKLDGVGIQVKGCMTRPKLRGPEKGKPKYLFSECSRTVIITNDDIERHKQLVVQK